MPHGAIFQLLHLPVLLLRAPIRCAKKVLPTGGDRGGTVDLPVGGINEYRAQQVLFALKAAGRSQEDDEVAELWLASLVAAQAAVDDILDA